MYKITFVYLHRLNVNNLGKANQRTSLFVSKFFLIVRVILLTCFPLNIITFLIESSLYQFTGKHIRISKYIRLICYHFT
jgi:hypothetical protein